MVQMPQLQYVLKGARCSTAGRAGRTRLPIMPEILERLRGAWEPDELWAASTLCFLAFLRMGEAVSLSNSGYDYRFHFTYGDILFNKNRDHYLSSKTDAS